MKKRKKMKTKNKTIVFVEIAIVLCSVFLVVLPTITAASEFYEPGPLDVFGNANEDDTIDMRDTTYIKLVIFRKKLETKLADANNDGKISMLDVGQTKLIILGKENELTILEDPQWADPTRRVVTIKKPVKRVVVRGIAEAETLRLLNAADTIVGVGDSIKTEKAFGEVYFPELSKLPSVGSRPIDYEAVLDLNPDVFLESIQNPEIEKLPGVTVLCQRISHPRDFPISERVRLLGYVFDKREEAEKYINWYDGLVDTILERIEGISETEMPRAMYASAAEKNIKIHITSGGGQILEIVPCINIGREIPEPWTGGHPTVDIEWLIELNPDYVFLFRTLTPFTCGYITDDASEIATACEAFRNRSEFARITAVKEKKVYMICSGCMTYSPSHIILVAYYAKWMYPYLFEDMDPKAIHQEYVDFQGIDFNVREHGVFVYPPLE